MECMETASNVPSSEISEANRALVADLQRIFGPLQGMLKPEIESIVVYDPSAQISVIVPPDANK